MSPATLLSPRDVAFARAVREDGLLERLQARPRPVPPLASRPPRPSRGECSPGPPPGGPQERRRNVPAINRFPDASVDPTFFNELFHKRVPPAQSAAAHHPPPGAWTRWSAEDLFAAARDSSAEAMSRRLAEAASRVEAREKRRLSPLAQVQGFGSRRCGDDDGAITYFNPSNPGAAPDYSAWKDWKEGCAAAVWKGCWASDDTPTSNAPTQIDVWTGAEWTGNNGGTNTNTTCTPWRSALSAIGYDTEWYTQMDEWRDALPRAKECVHSHGWSSYSVCQWPCIPDFCTPNDCPADTACGPVPAGQCDHDWQCPSTTLTNPTAESYSYMTNYQATFSSPDVNTRLSQSDFTYSAWINPARTTAGGRLEIFGGTDKGFYLIADENSFYCQGDANVYGIHVGYSGAFSTPCPIPTGGDSYKFFHVAVTKSGTTYKFYVNGELHETETGTDSAGQTDQLASMSIGKGVSKMRGVAILDRALSDAEVRCLAFMPGSSYIDSHLSDNKVAFALMESEADQAGEYTMATQYSTPTYHQMTSDDLSPGLLSSLSAFDASQCRAVGDVVSPVWTCPTSPPDCVFSSNLADGVVGSAEHDDKFVGGNSGYVKGGRYNAQGTEWSLKDSGNLEIGFWTKLVVGCAAAATATTSRARLCAHPPPAVLPAAPAGASMPGRTTSTCTSTRSCS